MNDAPDPLRAALWALAREHGVPALIEKSAGANLDYIGRLCGVDRARRPDGAYRVALLNYIRTGSTAPVGDALDKLGELVRVDKPAPEGHVRLTFPNVPAALVARDIACPTCRRVFCRARVSEGAVVEPVCAGCIAEGRT